MYFRSRPLALSAILFPVFSSPVLASDEVTLPEMVVTAARLPQPQREVIGDVTVLTRASLERYRGQTLTEVLVGQPGLQLSNNGGPGKYTGLFIRGASAQQTLVLIDGIRFSSATSGSAAIQHLPLDQVERIEILRGPAASLYGSDAIGGVIQIFTRKGQATPGGNASIGIGNNGARQASANIHGQLGATRLALGLAHSETDGNNALRNPANSSYNSDRDGYRNSSASLNASHTLNQQHEIGASLLLSRATNHFDGYLFDMNTYQSVAQDYDYRDRSRQGAASVWSRHQLGERLAVKLQAGGSIDDSDNYSPVSNADRGDHIDTFTTRQQQLSWQNELKLGAGTATLGLETLSQRVGGTTAYDVNHRRINSLLAGYLAQVDNWTLQTNLRNDDNSQFGRHTSGQAGASVDIGSSWQLGGNIGTGFRAPNFNELYYPGFGNAELKPEKSSGGELFARYNRDRLDGQLTVYRTRFRDLLQYDATRYTTGNIGRAQINGATLKLDWQQGLLQLGGQMDWLRARDRSGDKNQDNRLPRRADRAASAYVGLQQDGVQVRLELQAQGKRYDDAANGKRMAGYAVANLHFSTRLDQDWQLALRLNNLADRQYATAADYAAPGRNGLLSLSRQFK